MTYPKDIQMHQDVLAAQRRAAEAEEAYWAERKTSGMAIAKLRESALKAQIERDQAQAEGLRSLARQSLLHLQKLDKVTK